MSEKPHSAAALSLTDAVAMVVGIVVGSGIFRLPPLVASNTGSVELLAVAWILGAVIVGCGAACYARLALTYPGRGGEYAYLHHFYGPAVSFLFAWARVWAIQTGSIAATAYIFGDYLAKVFDFGPRTPMVFALAATVGLTLVNILGLQAGKWTQNLLTLAKVLGLLFVLGVVTRVTGVTKEATTAGTGGNPNPAIGLAMVFVLYTYGGWNEAAYLVGDMRRPGRGYALALGISTVLIAIIYLAVNGAYVKVLGVSGLGQSQAPAADVVTAAIGPGGGVLVALLVAVAALGTANATIFTGSRSIYALGTDHPSLAWLGRWHPRWNTPATAFVLQGALATGLVLVAGLGEETRQAFESAVEYTAPAFWAFMLLLSWIALVRAWRDGKGVRAVALLLVAVVFVGMCAYMLYSSLAYTKVFALVGAAVVLAGLPVYALVRARETERTAGA